MCRSPLGANYSQGSPVPRNGPPEQSEKGTATRCHDLPPSKELAEMILWKGPWIHAATMFLGLTGLTATNGSAASSRVQGPGRNEPMPSSQLPTALGRESSTSGPS